MSVSAKALKALREKLEKLESEQQKEHGDVRVRSTTARSGLGGRERRQVPVEAYPPGPDTVTIDGKTYTRAGDDEVGVTMRQPVPMHMLRNVPLDRAEAMRQRLLAGRVHPGVQRVLDEPGTPMGDVQTETPDPDSLHRMREQLRNERIRKRLMMRLSPVGFGEPIFGDEESVTTTPDGRTLQIVPPGLSGR